MVWVVYIQNKAIETTKTKDQKKLNFRRLEIYFQGFLKKEKKIQIKNKGKILHKLFVYLNQSTPTIWRYEKLKSAKEGK